MSRLGFKSVLYHGDLCLGEVDTFPTRNQNFKFPNNEIRINYISQSSERCPPLSILQTISPFAVRCKLKSNPVPEESPLYRLHASCFHERKTAVVILGDEEIHVVAMLSKQEKLPCFWCCSVSIGLYGSCLGMLNLRCLSIVFDLDETLIVANTMKSFEDRIEALQRRIACENDPIRVSGMSAELKRYIDDKMLLKQYVESDNVMDNGKLLKVQPEEVPMFSNGEKVIRPVIRLQEKNIVLTRINPEIRDTSVLVRLRPAWEDLRSYLTAKGRKRFEVYVCTMAERDYALEMWRLLDPEAHLISLTQLVDRVICVKSGGRKSLLNVFQDGICHPKMAMVIDDRMNVWEEKDQPRVHVVPPFAPYYAPQAEIAHPVPVLCVARNVACNVRAGFFRKFDETLLRRIYETFFEDDVSNLPYAPDVSDYLVSEDTLFIPNGNREIAFAEGMNGGAEVDRRLTRMDEKHIPDFPTTVVTNGPELKPENSQQPHTICPNVTSLTNSRTTLPLQKPSFPGAPGGGEVNPTEMDHDVRRRLLIMQHGHDAREQNLGDPSLLSRLPTQVLAPLPQPRGGWLVEESPFVQESDVSLNKEHAHPNVVNPSVESRVSPGLSSHSSQVKTDEENLGHAVRQRQNHPQTNLLLSTEIDEVATNQAPAKLRESQSEVGRVTMFPSSVSVGVLQEIGQRCGSKVEFRSVVSTSKDLQFSVEVLFTGEKIGVGMGKTKKDAQQQAAENALRSLADKYVAHTALDSRAENGGLDKLSCGDENGFLWDTVSPGPDEVLPNKGLHYPSTSEIGGEEIEGSQLSQNQQTVVSANTPRPH